MIHVTEEVTNINGDVSKLAIAYDLNGMHIVRTPAQGEPDSILLTHEEEETLYRLMMFIRPRYRNIVNP